MGVVTTHKYNRRFIHFLPTSKPLHSYPRRFSVIINSCTTRPAAKFFGLLRRRKKPPDNDVDCWGRVSGEDCIGGVGSADAAVRSSRLAQVAASSTYVLLLMGARVLWAGGLVDFSFVIYPECIGATGTIFQLHQSCLCVMASRYQSNDALLRKQVVMLEGAVFLVARSFCSSWSLCCISFLRKF